MWLNCMCQPESRRCFDGANYILAALRAIDTELHMATKFESFRTASPASNVAAAKAIVSSFWPHRRKKGEMTTELATTEGWTPEQLALIKSMFAKDMSNDELQLFLYTAKRCGLDPLARQIYAVKRGGKLTIQTGIDGYRLIADRTGKLAGISDYSFAHDTEGQKYPSAATVTVKKLISPTMVADFTATARWGEYNAGGPMWQKMPYLMLEKCSEALALRKAFPCRSERRVHRRGDGPG